MGEYKSFKKLVRDLIPSQLEARGITVIYSTIADFFGRDKFAREKLVEEATEVLNAKTKEELLEELADLDEVKDALLVLHGFSYADLMHARMLKNEAKGSFSKWQYLDSTQEPDEPNGQQK
jgi:predicted house-cleaning noncanonical NTP pyrophosphatase (MazG superfamily)